MTEFSDELSRRLAQRGEPSPAELRKQREKQILEEIRRAASSGAATAQNEFLRRRAKCAALIRQRAIEAAAFLTDDRVKPNVHLALGNGSSNRRWRRGAPSETVPALLVISDRVEDVARRGRGKTVTVMVDEPGGRSYPVTRQLLGPVLAWTYQKTGIALLSTGALVRYGDTDTHDAGLVHPFIAETALDDSFLVPDPTPEDHQSGLPLSAAADTALRRWEGLLAGAVLHQPAYNVLNSAPGHGGLRSPGLELESPVASPVATELPTALRDLWAAADALRAAYARGELPKSSGPPWNLAVSPEYVAGRPDPSNVRLIVPADGDPEMWEAGGAAQLDLFAAARTRRLAMPISNRQAPFSEFLGAAVNAIVQVLADK